MAADKTIGKKIQHLRKQAEMTQAELGNAVFPEKEDGNATNIIKNIETGRRQVKPSEIAKILKAVGSDETELHELFETKEGLRESQYPDWGPEARSRFPEIDNYYKMHSEAMRLGDEDLALEILRSMSKKLEELIGKEEIKDKEKAKKKA